VLGFVIADMLFTRFPTHSEGYKSKVKAGIVSAVSLARLAENIDLGRFVLLGRGEEKTGGLQKHAILADGYEALIAAIYLDGGIDAAREFIVGSFGPLIAAAGDQAAEATFTEDWKSALQEWLQANGRGLPSYRLAATDGPDHRKRFDVEVLVAGEVTGRASGRSKKDAEQQAAREALALLKRASPRSDDNASGSPSQSQ
jgi:ribonuclease-3